MEKFGNIAYVIADSGEVPAILNHSHELEELFAVRVSINFLPRKVKYREVLGTLSLSRILDSWYRCGKSQEGN